MGGYCYIVDDVDEVGSDWFRLLHIVLDCHHRDKFLGLNRDVVGDVVEVTPYFGGGSVLFVLRSLEFGYFRCSVYRYYYDCSFHLWQFAARNEPFLEKALC